MQHFHLRCKHCHKEYVYCTYGNGPEYGTEPGCSMDYCAECQNAINAALDAIPVRFERRLKEIKPTAELLELFRLINNKKKIEGLKTSGKLFLPLSIAPITVSEYDNSDTCIYNGRTFCIEYNNGEFDKAKVSIAMEYDRLEKRFTDKYWSTNDKDNYIHNVVHKIIARDLVPVKPMEPPTGLSILSDITSWDIVTQKERIKYEPEHIKRTYTRKLSGVGLLNILTKERDDTIVSVTYDPETVYDFMDYKITYEKYDDEKVETVTEISLNLDNLLI